MLKLAFTTPATIIQLFQTTQTPKYAASTHRSYTSLKTSKVKIINPSLIHEKVKSPMRNYDRRTDVRKDNLMHCSLSKSLNFIPSLFPSLKTMSFKGSASQLNKFVLKDSPHIQKLSGTYLFPRSRHQNIYKLSKNPAPSRVRNHWLFATSRCSQPLVAISNHSLLIATSGCEQ